jgi:hypothetical protein
MACEILGAVLESAKNQKIKLSAKRLNEARFNVLYLVSDLLPPKARKARRS